MALAERIERRMEVDRLHCVARTLVPHLGRTVVEGVVPIANITEVVNLQHMPYEQTSVKRNVIKLCF